MSRAPSPATQIKNATRQIRALQADLARMRQEMMTYRVRATQAEMAVAEWKLRFDALLKVVPSSAASNSHLEEKP